MVHNFRISDASKFNSVLNLNKPPMAAPTTKSHFYHPTSMAISRKQPYPHPLTDEEPAAIQLFLEKVHYSARYLFKIPAKY